MPKKSVGDNTITITFDDRSESVHDVTKFPADIQHNLMLHGLSQKLGDSYSSAGKAENPLAFAKGAVERVAKQLMDGAWQAAREGGGGSRTTVIAEAIARAFGTTIEVVNEKILNRIADNAGTSDEDKKAALTALRADPQVRVAMAEIKAERAKTAAAKADAAPSAIAAALAG